VTVRATGSSQTAGAGIALSPTTAGPGDSVTVRGTGFGRNERVTLAVNGAALSSVVTRADGTFTATFRAPNGLLSGANSLGASGATSGRSAVATLTGRLTTATTFYFVGASTMPGEQARLPLLNPNARPARVNLTFYYNNGARAAHRLVSGRGLHRPHLPRDACCAQIPRGRRRWCNRACCRSADGPRARSPSWSRRGACG